jgi:hypothetical protein
VTHEGYHVIDIRHASPAEHAYFVRPDRMLRARRLSTFTGTALISAHPRPLPQDNYVAAYLHKSGGWTSFHGLLDELNAYTHSLASAYCTRDGIQGSVSHRNGVYAMLLFVELSLRVGRTQYPAEHAAWRADPGTRATLFATWKRAALWLERTQGESALETFAAEDNPNGLVEYRAWATEPSRVAEIWGFLAP